MITSLQQSLTQNDGAWPDRYMNNTTGKVYEPHGDAEHQYVYNDAPRYALAKGGEGGGKSVALIIKTLERLRRGMDGIMGSPDLPHFKRSLWPEFKRWCPWHMVIEQQRRRGRPEWEPSEPFSLTFTNGARLFCGGFEDPGAWEGPNVSFAAIDEARRKKDPAIVKVLDGRVRIPGPQGEPPQLFIATTPRKHWLFDMFGPLTDPDQYAAFKARSLVITMLTRDNALNLSDNYVEDRASSLTEAEARVLLEAEWEDVDDIDRFLPSILWWDACLAQITPLNPWLGEPLVLAVDAGVSNDTFGVVGVTYHPTLPDAVAVRYVRSWVPDGKPLNFDHIEVELRAFCKRFPVIEIAYDPYQLHQMMNRLRSDGVANTVPFNQGADRLVADKNLLDLILTRRIVHDGNAELRQHIDNADRKTAEENRLRLVKRNAGLKIDLAVALSMAVKRMLEQSRGTWNKQTLGALSAGQPV